MPVTRLGKLGVPRSRKEARFYSHAMINISSPNWGGQEANPGMKELGRIAKRSITSDILTGFAAVDKMLALE